MEQNELKRQAAEAAITHVTDGMIVGLGTGSTAAIAIKLLGERVKNGLSIRCIPTSIASDTLAREYGMEIIELDTSTKIDITIDGADEVDDERNLIKGLGGALVREKIVAYHTEREIIIVDDSKRVSRLGEKAPVPVEVTTFGYHATAKALEKFGCSPTLRMQENSPFVSDNNNHIIDCHFPSLENAAIIHNEINAIPGVVENGLFINLTHTVIVASPEGIISLSK